jgi:hypothetical protein
MPLPLFVVKPCIPEYFSLGSPSGSQKNRHTMYTRIRMSSSYLALKQSFLEILPKIRVIIFVFEFWASVLF